MQFVMCKENSLTFRVFYFNATHCILNLCDVPVMVCNKRTSIIHMNRFGSNVIIQRHLERGFPVLTFQFGANIARRFLVIPSRCKFPLP